MPAAVNSASAAREAGGDLSQAEGLVGRILWPLLTDREEMLASAGTANPSLVCAGMVSCKNGKGARGERLKPRAFDKAVSVILVAL